MSAFNVTWSATGKPTTGKVFARKRKVSGEVNKTSAKNTQVNNNNNTKHVNEAVTSRGDFVNRKKNSQVNVETKEKLSGKTGFSSSEFVKSTERPRFTPKLHNDSPDFTSKLVKRKQKKDKIAAKAAAAEENADAAATSAKPSQTHSLFSVGHKNVYVNTKIKGKSVVEKVFSAGKKFSDLDIHKFLVSNLEKINFTALTNVQEKSIPEVLSGKNVLIRSQTGSGKTLAYAVPIIDALQSITPKLQRSQGVQAIVIVPTRELALQTHELFGKINTFQWLVVGYLCGGENRNTEKTRLRKGVHVLIATPGRLLDHMLHTAAFKMTGVRCLVLDEADRLLDMGFKRDIVKIVEELDQSKVNAEYDPLSLLKGKKNNSALESASEEPFPLRDPLSKSRQTILLSATLTKGIAELADFIMKEHTYVDALDESETVNPDHMVIPNTVKQQFIVTHVKHRLFTLSAMLISKVSQVSKMFVFMATSQMVDYHYELFTRCLVKMPRNRGKLKSGDVVLLDSGIEDSDDEEEIVADLEFFKLHGSMDQAIRKDVFTRFRAAKTAVTPEQIAEIRTIVYDFYITEKRRPTLTCILQKLNDRQIGFSGGLSTLNKVLKSMGFRWKKTDDNRKALMEKYDIRLKRVEFLNKIAQYRAEGRNIVYTDETYIHSSHAQSKGWSDEEYEGGIKKPVSKGQRLFIVHAGGEQGFVPNALLICKSGSKSGDYHDDMTHANFMKWVQAQLIPNLPERSVLVIDNASYHNVAVEKNITSANLKSDMIKWLNERGIEFEERLTKAELYKIIQENKSRFPLQFQLDTLMEQHGHSVLRLPPYHSDFNPIEKIWALVKNWVAARNVTFKLPDVKELAVKKFADVGVDDWKQICDHVKEFEATQIGREHLLDDAVDSMRFSVNTGSSSEEEDEEEIESASDEETILGI